MLRNVDEVIITCKFVTFNLESAKNPNEILFDSVKVVGNYANFHLINHPHSFKASSSLNQAIAKLCTREEMAGAINVKS